MKSVAPAAGTNERTDCTMTTNTTIDRTLPQSQPSMQDAEPFSGRLYRFHGFRVFDRHGERIGIVDWIWTNEKTGVGDHIGLQIHWLRGKARAVPATGARVDTELGLVRLPFNKHQIAGAPRFRIDQGLSSVQRAEIKTHFAPT